MINRKRLLKSKEELERLYNGGLDILKGMIKFAGTEVTIDIHSNYLNCSRIKEDDGKYCWYDCLFVS